MWTTTNTVIGKLGLSEFDQNCENKNESFFHPKINSIDIKIKIDVLYIDQ